MENFAVNALSKNLLDSFRKDAEEIGWKFNDTESLAVSLMGTYLVFEQSLGCPSFYRTNSIFGDTKCFCLKTQYGEALAFAKKVWDSEIQIKEKSKCSFSIFTISKDTIKPSMMERIELIDWGEIISRHKMQHSKILERYIFSGDLAYTNKSPIVGELAIFWKNEERQSAVIGKYLGKYGDGHIFYRTPSRTEGFSFDEYVFDNAIFFESIEQYKNFLNEK